MSVFLIDYHLKQGKYKMIINRSVDNKMDANSMKSWSILATATWYEHISSILNEPYGLSVPCELADCLLFTKIPIKTL